MLLGLGNTDEELIWSGSGFAMICGKPFGIFGKVDSNKPLVSEFLFKSKSGYSIYSSAGACTSFIMDGVFKALSSFFTFYNL